MIAHYPDYGILTTGTKISNSGFWVAVVFLLEVEFLRLL